VGPSLVPGLQPQDQPEVLSLLEIEALVEMFARAAERARTAGYDAVEFHGSHGYLISQFISPFENHRSDRYGGSLESRLRFAREIVERAKQLVGNDFPLTMRLSAQEFVPGGQTVEDSQAGARLLEQAGLSALHISAGGRTDPEWIVDPMDHPQGSKTHLAAKIKEAVGIPVIAVGVIRDPSFAERVLTEGSADFVALGRALLADPDWPLKAATGREHEIRKCFSCNHCDGVRNAAGLSIRCVTNPEVGDPDWPRRSQGRAATRKRVVVVGGGPAGIEVARIAAARGHDVALHGQAAELGGQLLIARNVRGKDKINWLLDDLKASLQRSRAEVHLGSRVTPEMLRALAPEVLVLACGGEPIIPIISGCTGSRVTTAWEIIANRSPGGAGRIAVIGGSSTGCEAALDLARDGATVVLVEQRDELAPEMEPIARSALLKYISAQAGLSVRLGWQAKELVEEGVAAVDGIGRREVIIADQVVLAVGVAPAHDLPGLLDRGFEAQCQVYTIGDCAKPSNITAALADARAVGCLV
jgi:NADPH-dependent 2,4-dienoyl-CoA reductase/sulfur reductase-like enzyme